MKVGFSSKASREIERIHRKDPQLAKRIEKQVALFQKDTKHPSLRIHKLSGYDNLWSLSVTTSIRILYILLEEDEAYISDIGTHDQVYRRN